MEMVLERERPAPAKGVGNETSHPSNPTKPKQPEAPLRGLDAKDKDAVYRCLTEAVSSSELYIEFSELGTLLNTDMHPPQTFACTVFYATPFHALRRLYCLSDFNFVHSLWSCRKWPTSGGKKGQLSKTLDSRYLLKSIEKAEFKWFVLICPAYFAYMVNACARVSAFTSVLFVRRRGVSWATQRCRRCWCRFWACTKSSGQQRVTRRATRSITSPCLISFMAAT